MGGVEGGRGGHTVADVARLCGVVGMIRMMCVG